jgi:hypothetical protein
VTNISQKKINYLKERKIGVLEDPIQQIFYVQDYHNINSPQEVAQSAGITPNEANVTNSNLPLPLVEHV